MFLTSKKKFFFLGGGGGGSAPPPGMGLVIDVVQKCTLLIRKSQQLSTRESNIFLIL